ncbi:T9SS type A sorting domain-containing protein [Spirosoma flavum]|uniref:T9SS type A sorting domain-containing protein n=1 Tax=Spirosoma flavum TaxID=2048557 RepID=A0ABW6ANC6_9BACT
MKKLIICKTTTILFGVLAIVIHSRSDMTIGHLPNNKLIGTVLGLLSGISGSQWIEYQKRLDVTQSGWPIWVRRLLFSSILLLTVLTAQAQTTWTAHPQMPDHFELVDVAYGAGRYVAVGDIGVIRSSTDGEGWKTQPKGPLQTERLSGIVYANNRFVVVGNNGGVMTSINGLTWAKQVSGTTEVLNAVAYGGGRFVAVGRNGTIITSTDGISWTRQTSGTADKFTAIAYGGSQFVAVGINLIKTSPDGVIWTTRTFPNPFFSLGGVTAGPKGSFVAVGDNHAVFTSTDGITWTPRPLAGSALYFVGIAYNSILNKYVAISSVSGCVVTSGDGVNWNTGSSGTNHQLTAVRYLQGKFLAVGEDDTIRSSSSGLIWKPVTLDPLIALYGAAFGNGHYVAVGAYSPEYYTFMANVALTSGDGINYTVGETIHVPNGAKQFNDVAFGNGLFAAVGTNGVIQTSVDGKVWDFRHMLDGQTLNAVTFGGGQFIAIGDNGFIARSNNGKTWNSGFTGLAKNFNGISYANGQFTAVGQYGAIATSTNGIIWTARPSGTTKQLKSVAFGNGMWLAVGHDGISCRSLNGTTWTSFIVDASAYFNHVVFANGKFVAVGLDGKIFTFPSAFIWTARASKTSAHLWRIIHGANQFVAVGETTSQNDWNTAIVVTSSDDYEATANAQPTSLTSNAQARLAAEENGPELLLQAMTYPNPVEEEFTINIEGASGQQVRLWLVDGQGHTIEYRQIRVEESQHNESMRLGQREPGMYLLRVSTADQTKTLKVLKR